ncbi:conserved Plasmodium protein, unknown function [Plasmodium relictum]|uniref:Uncharacterized protein n=1 Tax=Plasmodium relictum TaxID=85471 RepID=A0A1J1H2R2_PLARL|nr:conserved Plasmodium protein, unknown function [Plasmodium relictum]CRG99005.1 conserved Plasmodium protein, unknown function [Plasmodium relictum]
MELSLFGIISFLFLISFCLSYDVNEKREKENLRNVSNIVTIEVLPSDEDDENYDYDYLLNEFIGINNNINNV